MCSHRLTTSTPCRAVEATLSNVMQERRDIVHPPHTALPEAAQLKLKQAAQLFPVRERAFAVDRAIEWVKLHYPLYFS